MVDKDLLSIQEARSLVRSAQKAKFEIRKLTQSQIDALTEAIGRSAVQNAESLAKLAVEETGFGRWEDKKSKNLLASEMLLDSIRGMKTVGIISEDDAKGIWEIAKPAGVIAALIPSTNPTSTTIFKTIIALKAGNAIVFAPHPSALNCINATVDMIKRVLAEQGVPQDLVNAMSVPTVQGTEELMKQSDLILATGGPGMVKAAYSSGKPALGVGSGNVPVYLERSANIDDAVDKIIASKTFDNGTVCASEQAILADRVITEQVKATLKAKGCLFLEGDDVLKVKAIMERPGGGMNPKIVGKDAQTLASMAGISIPAGTRLLVYEEEGIGPDYPFSKEKLTALIGYYTVEDWRQACEYCHKLLINGGIGHTLSIHSTDRNVIREFAIEKPVSRLVVNTGATQGAVGISTALSPSLTLGCGNEGGSSTSDNVGPEHLFNIRRVAFGKDQKTPQAAAAPAVNVDEVARITELVMQKLKEGAVI
ncbi:MAG: acetaldehyde dehydrogenase (acetylating) [Desulforhopalus sp.]|jgi:acetaldehyde dehydrogenase (acetylating)